MTEYGTGLTDDEGDAYVALCYLNVESEDQARAILEIWARRGRLTPDQVDRVVRQAVATVLNHERTHQLRGLSDPERSARAQAPNPPAPRPPADRD